MDEKEIGAPPQEGRALARQRRYRVVAVGEALAALTMLGMAFVWPLVTGEQSYLVRVVLAMVGGMNAVGAGVFWRMAGRQL